jgi:hypothetical protein
MQTYARIQGGTIAEIISTSADITTLYHPDLVWVNITNITPQPTLGWTYNGSGFAAPVPPVVSPQQLSAYASAKQAQVLAAVFSYTLADGSATLTTACDPVSISGINSLMQWASINALAATTPTRTYYNEDWSPHAITPAQMLEFGAAVGAHIESIYADMAAVLSAISAGTITSTAQIDAADWS